jgi:fatty-acyl-CoA synthase
MGDSSISLAGLRGSLSDSIFELKVLREAGIVAPMRPDKAVRIGTTFLRWGASPATGVATAAIHHPHEIAIADERGALTWERLHHRSNALAHSFAAMGIGHGDGVGIMCRNHRGFIEATLAAAKIGASALYLNTMFAGGARGRRRSSTTRSSPSCWAKSRTRSSGSSPGPTASPRR